MSLQTTANLFPIPISVFQVPPVSQEVLDFVKQVPYQPYPSEDKYELDISTSFQVLDDYPKLESLKSAALVTASQYWHDILGVASNYGITIKNSWICKHKHNNFNAAHIHNGCLFVCTIYLDTDSNCGNIVFKKNLHYLNLFPELVHLDYDTHNLINSKTYSVTPTNNMAVCFPAHLEHYAEPNLSGKDRYCLTIDFYTEGMKTSVPTTTP